MIVARPSPIKVYSNLNVALLLVLCINSLVVETSNALVAPPATPMMMDTAIKGKYGRIHWKSKEYIPLWGFGVSVIY